MPLSSTCFAPLSSPFARCSSRLIALMAITTSVAACTESAVNGPPASTAAAVGATYTSEIAISATSWRNVGEGQLMLVRVDSPDSFAGELACHSSPGPTCGNGKTSEADLGPKIFTRRAPAAGEILGDGAVPSGRYLCCGAVSGAGGKVTVSYMK